MGGTVSLVLLLLFLWGLCSQRVERVELTAPAVFVLVGLVLATCLGSMDLAPSGETVKGLAEICLTWILFADAARLSFRVLRPDLGLYLRLLLIGLPLCIGLGALLAVSLLPGVSGWAAVFVGAALAPTDAALGASMMSDPVVPERIRRLINVESGLNDGIATPVVVLALVGAAGAAGAGPDANGKAVVELAIGFAYGSVLGLAGGGCYGRRCARAGRPRSLRARPYWPSPCCPISLPSPSAATGSSRRSSPDWPSAPPTAMRRRGNCCSPSSQRRCSPCWCGCCSGRSWFPPPSRT